MDILQRLQNAIHMESAAIAPQMSETIEAMRAAQEEIERLRAALKPFADYLDAFEQAFPADYSDDDIGWISTVGRITFGDLRRARAGSRR